MSKVCLHGSNNGFTLAPLRFLSPMQLQSIIYAASFSQPEAQFILLPLSGLTNQNLTFPPKPCRLNKFKLAAFLERVEAGYSNTNPYHNNIHAADVLHRMRSLLVLGKLFPSVLDLQASLSSCLNTQSPVFIRAHQSIITLVL